MKRFLWTNLALATMVFGMICTQALADDAKPPGWRGAPGTTFQHWHFPAGNSAGPDPDDFENANGMPAMSVFGEGTGGASWLADHLGADGVWEIIDASDGRLEFVAPNLLSCGAARDAAGQDQKVMRVQVTYLKGTSGSPVIEITAADQTPFTIVGAPVEVTLPNGYTHQTTTWTGFTSSAETVKLYPAGGPGGGGTTFFDQIVIDTHCGPLPPVPTVGEWGLPMMLLLVVTAGTIMIRRGSHQRVATM